MSNRLNFYDLLSYIIPGSLATILVLYFIGSIFGAPDILISYVGGFGETFVDAVKAGEVSLLGMSAMLTTTAPYMGVVIQALKEANVSNKVKVMVGGAVVTDVFA